MSNQKETGQLPPRLEIWKSQLPPYIFAKLEKIYDYVEGQSKSSTVSSPLANTEIADLIASTMEDLRDEEKRKRGELSQGSETVEQKGVVEVLGYLEYIIQNTDLGDLVLDITIARHRLIDIVKVVRRNPEYLPELYFWLRHMPSLRNKELRETYLRQLAEAKPALLEYLEQQVENSDEIFLTVIERIRRAEKQDQEMLSLLRTIALHFAKQAEEGEDEDTN